MANRLAACIELQRRLSRSRIWDAMSGWVTKGAPFDSDTFLHEMSPRIGKTSRTLGESLEARCVQIVFAVEDRFPARLCQVMGTSVPPLLYCMGNLRLLDHLSVSIIGTRRPTALGRRVAEAYAAELAGRGVGVISGNAPGIDAAAHQGVLDAGGFTIVCPPVPLDKYLPSFNCGRREERVLVLSAFEPGSAVQPWNFLARNEIVAAHGGASIVAETGLRGGTHNTVGHVRRFRRPLFCIQPGPDAEHAKAHDLLLRSGAKPLPPSPTDEALEQVITAAATPLEIAPRIPDMFS